MYLLVLEHLSSIIYILIRGQRKNFSYWANKADSWWRDTVRSLLLQQLIFKEIEFEPGITAAHGAKSGYIFSTFLTIRVKREKALKASGE